MAIPADRMLLLRKTTFNAGCSRKTSGEGLFSATFVLVLTTPVCHVGPGNATDTRATMIFNDECRVETISARQNAWRWATSADRSD